MQAKLQYRLLSTLVNYGSIAILYYFLLSANTPSRSGWMLFIIMVILLAQFVLIVARGQSIGQMIMQLRVVDRNGNPADVFLCLARVSCSIFSTLMFIPGIVSLILIEGASKRSLTDAITNSKVEYYGSESSSKSFYPRWVSFLDWMSPLMVVLLLFAMYLILLLLYIFAGLVTFGYLWMALSDKIALMDEVFGISISILAVTTILLQAYLFFFKSTTIFRSIFKKKRIINI